MMTTQAPLSTDALPPVSPNQWHPLTQPAGKESGWLLFCARLPPLRQRSNVMLRWQHQDGTQQQQRLPVARSGRICELIAIAPGSGLFMWQAGVTDHSEARLSWVRSPECCWRMLRRITPFFWRTPRAARLSAGLTLPLMLTRPTHAYRLAGELRDHNHLDDYPAWLARHYRLGEGDIAMMTRQLQRWKQVPRVRLHLVGTNDLALRVTLYSITRLCYPMSALTVTTTQPIDGEWPFSLMQGGEPQREEWQWIVPEGCQLDAAALFRLAHVTRRQPDLKLVYGDHDQVDSQGQPHSPNFKPDWSPTLLLGQNYIGWCGLWRFDAECLPDTPQSLHQHWLTLGEQLTEQHIAHIPALLMHIPDSLQSRADEVLAAVTGFAKQSMLPFRTSLTHHLTCRLHWPLPARLPTVSVIIPTRNGLSLLRPCLTGLLERTTYPNLEIIVVDNQSDDPQTLTYLTEMAHQVGVKVMAYDQPFNYAAINNRAIEQASGELVCLLNNDTEVISSGWLEEMVSHLLRPGVGVVGAKLYYSDGTVQHGGDAVGPGGCADHLHHRLAGDAPGYCQRAGCAQELSAVTGACLLTHKHLYLQLGGLNEQALPVAFNDVDYCLRVREVGYRVVWTPFAELYHHESVSRGKDRSPEQQQRAARELAYMKKRWKHVLQHDPYYNPNLNYDRPDFTLGKAPRVTPPWRR